jgi:hypothetical protein
VVLTLTPEATYVPDEVSVYSTGNNGMTVTLTAPDVNTRTFTMPAHDVTVSASFKADPDQVAVAAAESLIPASYTLVQAQASTEAAAKNLLVTLINGDIGSTGVTVSSADITVTGFTAATAGTVSSPAGTNGGFSFTVQLTKNSAILTTAARTCTVTATPYNGATYTVTVVPPAGGTGTVTASPTLAGIGASVTLTLAPSPGYGLASIQAYRTGSSSTTVWLVGAASSNTRTFTMPAYNVTVEVVFLPLSQLTAQQEVNEVRSLIENRTFTVAQATANSASGVQTWLTQQIGSLLGSTGVTLSGVTVSNFTAAAGGTSVLPAGTDGSFTFTASLAKDGAAAVTTAKTGRITATAIAPPPRYAITVAPLSNGTVRTDVASAAAGVTVTLTATPEAGYETDTIIARPASNAAATLALSGSGNTRTFIMPAVEVTITARFRKTQELVNRETVEEAKVSVEGGTFRIAQATGNTETDVKTWLAGVLNLLLSGQDAVITLRAAEQDVLAADVTLAEFTPAIAGSAANPAGTNGSYRFTVLLTKGEAYMNTLEIGGVIVAMPYAGTPVKRIELLSTGETRVRIINTGNLATGDLTVTVSGTNADRFTLSSAAPGSLAVGGEADITLIPDGGLVPGDYTATVTVNGDGLTPVSLEVTYRVLPTGNGEVTSHRVWASGSTLFLSATVSGEARIFGIGGQFVRAVSCTAGETVETTLPKGFYVVTLEGKAYKVSVYTGF